MSLRRQSRELALQMLFQREFSDTLDLNTSLDLFKNNFSVAEDVWKYARQILSGIEEHKSQIDQCLATSSTHWKIDRMSMVDVNIMRIAIYEMGFSNADVPVKVAINEALEICKKYSSSDSVSFVNGILNQAAKTFI